MKKIAIMTAGGDCAGLNSVIKSVVLSANKKGIEVVGIIDGYIGFVEKKYKTLTEKDVADIETIGGTILGSSNKENPSCYPDKEDKTKHYDMIDESISSLKTIGVEAMVIVGGDGTLDSAKVINSRGMRVIGIPKTIDNDMIASDPTIGFDTAISNVVDAISKLKSTAYSHRRVLVVETMGRTSGYLTLYGGFAAGADIILLPEKDYNLKKVCDRVKQIMENTKRYVIIAASEACKEVGKEEVIARIVENSFEQKRYGGVSERLARDIEYITGYESRSIILGHIQRGGSPCPSDIILGARLGDYAFRLLLEGESGYIVGTNQNELVKIKFPEDRVPRLLDFNNNDLIKTAKNMGIYFGD
ncbi:MAG: ATP-dependent 6-phosphofructokinase [Clostridia bacterium]|nr:ATP-dependent 6-phosphofructokinase [Clostridia bacterium]